MGTATTVGPQCQTCRNFPAGGIFEGDDEVHGELQAGESECRAVNKGSLDAMGTQFGAD